MLKIYKKVIEDRNIRMRISKIISLVLMAMMLMVWYSCERPTSPPNPNEEPNTTLANIPRENDTLFALQTMHWDGEDNDGYVSGYEYRYITQRLTMGDSITQEWKFTKETSLTIAFLYDYITNKQTFQVRAVDNTGAVDPSPAEKTIYTYKTIFPTTEIVTPENNQQYFAINEVTDWWQGIELNFTASDGDEQGEIVEYAWAADDGDWNWTNDTLIYISPENFSAPLNGEHVIRVTSRDNTNLVDPVGDSVIVHFVVPTFEKDILIIDETIESNFPYGVVQPTDQQVDDFYANVFGTTHNWDFNSNGMPPRDTLAQYKLIVWHADDLPSSQPHKLPANIEVIKDYMNVGGNFFMSGWRILKSFAWNEDFPFSFEPGSFVHDYLQIISVTETDLIGDCTGFLGLGDIYSDLRVDSTKIIDFPFVLGEFWGLGQVNLILQPAGFTDRIFSYDNDPQSSYFQYRGKTCGLRYYGSSFDAVILGFPVFFLNQDDATTMVNEILQTLNIN